MRPRYRPAAGQVQLPDGTEPPPYAPVPCRTYQVWNPDSKTGFRRCVYVGECVDTPNRGPADRWAEHLERSRWGDTIVTRGFAAAVADGTLVISDDVYPNKATAKEAERLLIWQLRPLYNVVHNRDNPDQIPKWVQEHQRAVRDRRNGVPKHRTWAALYGNGYVEWWRRPLVWWARQRPRTRRRLLIGMWQIDAALALAVVVFLGTDLTLPTSLAVGGGTIAFLALWIDRPRRRRSTRYAVNGVARWAIALAVAVQVLRDLGWM